MHRHEHAHSGGKPARGTAHGHDGTRNIRVAFFLNFGFTILEIVGGLLTNSLAILSDALHDLGDSVSLALSWYFEKISGRARTRTLTFGYRRYSLLGALINAFILLFGSLIILQEAIPRLWNPEAVEPFGMLLLALAGISINGLAVLRFRGSRRPNERVVMLHLLEDVIGWAAVLAASAVMLFFYLPILDPILSILITLFVLSKLYGNLRSIVRIFLQSVPEEIDYDEIERRLKAVPRVLDIHDLHIWTLDGVNHILTLHAVVDESVSAEETALVKQDIRRIVSERGISHATVEIERAEEECGHEEC